MRRAGTASPIEVSAARTRSRDSATALSGRPTTMKATIPDVMVTWASTSSASMPRKATVRIRATTLHPLYVLV